MTYWLATIRGLAPLGLCLGLLAGMPAYGQLDLGAIAGDAQGAIEQSPVTVNARIEPAKDGQPAQLVVAADIAAGWHIYSLTQKRGGPVPSKITIEPGTGYKLAGEFKPSKTPETHPEPAFNNLSVETHEGQVTWSAPLELSPGLDAAKVSIAGKLSFQACDASSCRAPASVKFTAVLGAGAAASAPAATAEKSAPPSSGSYKPGTAHVVIRGFVEPTVAVPGQKARLVITAEPEDGYHIYALGDRDSQTGSKPTLIVLDQTAGWKASVPLADGELRKSASATVARDTDRYYEKPVTWTIEIDVPRDAKPGDYSLGGFIGFQTCREDTGCDFPQAAKFRATLPVAAQTVGGKIPLEFAAAKSYKLVADLAAGKTAPQASAGFDPAKLQATSEAGGESLALMLAAALLGGLILNCMPCVLPVIGLKILGFVEQSHANRRRVFMLNLWFTLGLLSVFVVLASLAVFLNLGWGQQFTKPWFTIGMSGLVFAMALSFLGVWEIPIPGFVGSGTAGQMATQEGAAGAFAKGVFTTILATPCSGPFLGPLFGLLLRQPPAVVYAIFLCVGLGMASPYLLIGAFPQLIRLLPKPGAWMDTFKQAMGFVLLGTVVFLFMSVKQDYLVPAFGMLIGLWMGCWWIGRTPLTAELTTKLAAWATGCVLAFGVGLFAFTWLVPGKDVLPWEPFSRASLAKLTAEGKTVFVDFTADWCLTCKTNERVAINTRAVSELVHDFGIVPLKADWTEESDEIKDMLNLLGRNSIPVYAVFPAGRPNEPIVFSDLVTKGQVLSKLREAGPSKDASARTALLPAH
jgi:suppressor for copper-sensitivity B